MLERGLQIREVVREQRRHRAGCGLSCIASWRFGSAHQQGQWVKGLLFQSRFKLVGTLALLNGSGCNLFFFLNVIDAHQHGWISDVLDGLLVFVNEQLENTSVATDF
jgi:hypothetical protein